MFAPTFSLLNYIHMTFAFLLVGNAFAQSLQVIETPILRMNDGEPFIPAISIGLGTPPQSILAILDTGSSDLWVPQTASSLCADKQQQCSGKSFVTGSFEPNISTTFSRLQGGPKFFTNYVNGVSINGSFMEESVKFGNTTVAKTQLGLGITGILPSPLFPIAGLAYASAEGITQLGDKPYMNTVSGMRSKGLIKSTSFGLYLNDFRAAQGSLVFGGFDSAKFTGSLKAVPLSPDVGGSFTSFFVSWTSFTFQPGQSGKLGKSRRHASEINLAPSIGLPDALLDSGDPALSLDPLVIQSMGKGLGLKVVDNTLDALPCNSGDSGAKFVMGFKNNVTIDVPMSMMLVPLLDQAGNQQIDKTGNRLCQLPVESDPGSASLGAPFLQAAYVVFDMDQNQLLMAQAVINATTSKLEEYL